MSARRGPALSGAGEKNTQPFELYRELTVDATLLASRLGHRRRLNAVSLFEYVRENGCKLYLRRQVMRNLCQRERMTISDVRLAVGDLEALGVAVSRMAGGFEIIETWALDISALLEGRKSQ